MFNAPGFQLLINSRFFEDFSKVKLKDLNIGKVRELVMIDMNTLLFFADNFKNKEINPDETIDEYLSTIRHLHFNDRALKPASKVNLTSVLNKNAELVFVRHFYNNSLFTMLVVSTRIELVSKV